MKIVQVNAWQGRIQRPLQMFLKDEDPDIIFGQEWYHYPSPVPANSPWGYIDLTNQVARQNDYPYAYFSAANTIAAFGQTLEFGNVILSKFPLSQTSAHYTGENAGAVPLVDAANYDGNAGRNFQHAVADTPLGRINLINHHGHWVNQPLGDEVSLARLQKVADYIKALDGPTIFCGDLNLSPASDTIKQFQESAGLSNPLAPSGNDGSTTLSAAHYVPTPIICDYVLTTAGLNVKSFEISERLVSDHRALIAEITA